MTTRKKRIKREKTITQSRHRQLKLLKAFLNFTPTRGIASGHNLYTHRMLHVNRLPHVVLWQDMGHRCRTLMTEIFKGHKLRHRSSKAILALESQELIYWSPGRQRHILTDRGHHVRGWYLQENHNG